MKFLLTTLIKASVSLILMTTLLACGGADERKEKYLEKGKAYLEEKNYDKAKVEFKNVLQIDPKYAEAYFYMGQLEETKKDFLKAIGNYKKAIELNPKHINAKIKLATIYVIVGTNDYIKQARALLDEVKTIDQNHSEAAFVMATIEYKKGSVDTAISKMAQVIDEDRHLVRGIAMLSNIYVSKGRDAEAIALLKKGIADNVNEIYLRINLSQILIKNDDLAGAEAELINATNKEPEAYSLQVMLAKFYASTKQLNKAEKILRKGIEQDSEDAQRYLMLAQFLASRVDVLDSENELKKMIEHKPEMFELKFALVKLYQSTGKIDKAKDVLSGIVEAKTYDVDGIKAKNQLAQILLEEGDVAGAKAYVDEILEDHPNENDALLILSKLAMTNMDSTTAINGLRTVVKNDPKNAEAALLLAQAYEQNKESGLAENELKRSIEVNPVDEKTHINYARFLASKGRMDEAVVVIDRALTYFKDSYDLMEVKLKIISSQGKESEAVALLDIMEHTDATKADVNIIRGNYYLSKKNTVEAIEQYEKAYEKSKDKYKALELIVKAYLRNKQPEKAIERLQALLDENSSNAIAHQLLANIYLTQKKIKEARIQFKLASKAAKKWLLPYLSLAKTYLAENDFVQAELVYKDALVNVSNKIPVFMQLASIYERQENYTKAMSTYQQVIDLSANNMVAKNNYASLLLDHGSDAELSKVLELINGFEKIQQPAFQDTLAWAYAKSGDNTKAVEILKPLVDKAPEVAIFRYHLGYALYYMGDKAAAKSHLKIAVSSKQLFIGKEQASELLATI